jgi:Protein of unknown function (DUF1232)
MEAFFLFCILMALLFGIKAVTGHKNTKERAADLELIKRHPEPSTQIQTAFDMQEEPFHRQMPTVLRTNPVIKPQGGRDMKKFVVIALCVIYVICPIDFIPDFIPVLGWGDDLAAGLIGLRTLIK